MADAEETREHEASEDGRSCRRRGVDPVSLVAGILVLLASAYVLSGGAEWLSGVDLRWIVAGGAVAAGIAMLGASIRRGRS